MRRRLNNRNHRKNSTVADRQGAAGSALSVVSADAAEDRSTTRLWQLLPTAWNIIRPYWSSEDRWAGWGLLVVVVALTLGMVHINVLFSYWNNDFFSALQNKDQSSFLHQLLRVSWLVGLRRRLPALP